MYEVKFTEIIKHELYKECIENKAKYPILNKNSIVKINILNRSVIIYNVIIIKVSIRLYQKFYIENFAAIKIKEIQKAM